MIKNKYFKLLIAVVSLNRIFGRYKQNVSNHGLFMYLDHFWRALCYDDELTICAPMLPDGAGL